METAPSGVECIQTDNNGGTTPASFRRRATCGAPPSRAPQGASNSDRRRCTARRWSGTQGRRRCDHRHSSRCGRELGGIRGAQYGRRFGSSGGCHNWVLLWLRLSRGVRLVQQCGDEGVPPSQVFCSGYRPGRPSWPGPSSFSSRSWTSARARTAGCRSRRSWRCWRATGSRGCSGSGSPRRRCR